MMTVMSMHMIKSTARLSLLFMSIGLFAQVQAPVAPPARDAQAIAILEKAIAAAGGTSRIVSLQDFAATGKIIYYWAGEEVKGTATIRGRGTDQFRLDADLPTGKRSWAVSRGAGSLKETDGSITPIPYHNAVALGTVTLAHAKLAAAVLDQSFRISYVGLQQVVDQQFHQIHISRQPISGQTANNATTELGAIDIFIDPVSFMVVGIQDQTHPKQTMAVDISHSIYFSDFRPINGMSIPFLVTERINGQRTWSLQLDQIAFNTGLLDTDFQF
jgi:hypothetical protein